MEGPDPAAEGMPAWVKAFIAVAALAALTFLVLHFLDLAPTGHGP